MKTDSSESKKNLARDLKVFNDLPGKSQELTILKDSAEKSIGPKKAAPHDDIEQKAKT